MSAWTYRKYFWMLFWKNRKKQSRSQMIDQVMTIKTSTGSSKTELSSRGKRPFKVFRFSHFFRLTYFRGYFFFREWYARKYYLIPALDNIKEKNSQQEIEQKYCEFDFFSKLWAAVYPPRMAPFGLKLWENALKMIPNLSFLHVKKKIGKNQLFFDGFAVEKCYVGDRLKRVSPKFEAERSHPWGRNGHSRFFY